jgi:hypothetical protein
MRPTPWTSGLGALVLMALVVMYVRAFAIGATGTIAVMSVIGALWPARRITRA